jgi:integrase/recombinase XerC
MADQLSKHKPVSAAVRYRALRRFYNWMVSEEIVTNSPMAKVHQLHVPEQPVPILTEQELTALLKVTSGKDFGSRRDHPVIRLLVDTGIRWARWRG